MEVKCAINKPTQTNCNSIERLKHMSQINKGATAWQEEKTSQQLVRATLPNSQMIA